MVRNPRRNRSPPKGTPKGYHIGASAIDDAGSRARRPPVRCAAFELRTSDDDGESDDKEKLARGNTDSDNGNLKFDIAYLLNNWIYAFGVNALYGKTNGIGTAQRWDAHLQVDYKFTPKMFWFGNLEYQAAVNPVPRAM